MDAIAGARDAERERDEAQVLAQWRRQEAEAAWSDVPMPPHMRTEARNSPTEAAGATPTPNGKEYAYDRLLKRLFGQHSGRTVS